MSESGGETEAWRPVEGEDDGWYDAAQQEEIARLEAAAKVQLAPKPRRLAHSLSVARTAQHLASLYGVDPYLARCAGILHDWDKVVPHKELIERARALGINMGVELERVEPLLHGMVAARELPATFPELPREVWQAIDRHTTGAADMSPLDEVIFVADGIEPLRPASEGITQTRSLVGQVPLDDVYWNAFAGGIVYVIQTERYLYPGTLDIYNRLVDKRDQCKKEHA